MDAKTTCFMNDLILSDWTDIVQALAAIIGIAFLIINLLRTNKMINLQSNALRNSNMPYLKAGIKHGFLHQSVQRTELFPLIIQFSRNEVYNLTLTFEKNEFIDLSPTYSTYNLRKMEGDQLFFENLEVGEQIMIRAKVKPNPPTISDEFENINEYNCVMRLYAQTIKMKFKDFNGYQYSQTIVWEVANFDKVIIHPVVFL